MGDSVSIRMVEIRRPVRLELVEVRELWARGSPFGKFKPLTTNGSKTLLTT
ncbi:MAG: hypothetical protein OXG80_07820 [Chloroflexi bacterium]|nr:hypothetical protein [Chloroflexota bacterium]